MPARVVKALEWRPTPSAPSGTKGSGAPEIAPGPFVFVLHLRKVRVGHHFADLAEVPFVVGSDKQQPLVRVERTER